MKRFRWSLFVLGTLAAAQQPGTQWKFAVSGDSRNCGDIVMPAIAQGVRQSGAEFYWHLGDFRAIYAFDEDMVPPDSLGLQRKRMGISEYLSAAWPDFIAHQLTPFGSLPVYLAPGNHEFIAPMTRADYIAQFADWLDTPELRDQRIEDDPKDHKLRLYFHWVRGNVDFVSLDNVTNDQLDGAQMNWIKSVIARDEKSAQIRTIVIGMHEAFPGSLADAHSMNDWPLGAQTGRQVYEALLHAQDVAHKKVYVFASHSHFYMEDIYNSPAWKGKVLPGWIVGTAGAQRYRLPADVQPGPKAMTNVYGYLVATVAADGSIKTSFEKLSLEDLTKANPGVAAPLVRWCFEHNTQAE